MRWTIKPRFGARVDPTSVFGRDVLLSLAVNEGQGISLMNAAGTDSCALTGSPTWLSTDQGHGLGFTGTQYGLISASARYRPTAGFTFWARVFITSTANLATVLRLDDGTNRVGILDGAGAGTLRALAFTAAGTVAATSGGVLTANAWADLAATYDASTAVVTAYLNGSSVATATGTPGSAFVGTAAVPVGLFVNPNGLTTIGRGNLSHALILNRALSRPEIAMLGSNPWDLYEPPMEWREDVYMSYFGAQVFRRTLGPRSGSRGVI